MLEAFRNLVQTYPGRHLSIVYQGEIVSSNKIWSSPNYHYRSSIKQKYHKIFLRLLAEKPVVKFNEFSVVMFYNSRHDCDNLAIMAKMVADCMKGVYFVDDNSKFYKSITTVVDKSLPKNTLEIHFIGE